MNNLAQVPTQEYALYLNARQIKMLFIPIILMSPDGDGGT